jgi:hypothetical protein
MATPTGTISFNDVNQEIGIREPNQRISFADFDVRVLADKRQAGETISFADLRGREWFFTVTLPSSSSTANIRTIAQNAGWNGDQAVRFIINSGFRVGPGSIATERGNTAALVSRGTFPFGIELVNNGEIVGGGGNGGNGTGNSSSAGSAGVAAMELSTQTRLINNGRIAGGGGGGGGAGASSRTNAGGFNNASTTATAASSGAGGAGSGSRGTASAQQTTRGGDGGVFTAGARANEASSRNMPSGSYARSARAAARGGAAGVNGANGGAGAADGDNTGGNTNRFTSGGGAGGLAIRRARLVTIVTQGTLNGGIET